MKYKGLKKMFHIDEVKSNEMYVQRFNSESSNKLDIYINGFECFYFVTDEIINLIGKIYSINSWIDTAFYPNELPYISRNFLVLKSMIEEIRSSNKMEGIYSTRKEIENIISDKPPTGYKRFYGMVNKYQKIMNKEFPIVETSQEIRKLYDEVLLKDVLDEEAKDKPDGVIFRKNDVSIHSGTKIIHKGISGEINIIEMMDKSLKILNNDNINLLIRVAIFHYLFEYIHPFYNGNGRMGRFLVSGYLAKYLNLLSAFQLSIACLHNNKKYYKAFEQTNDIRNKADLTVFLIEFLEIYLSGLEELKENLENTNSMYKQMQKKINNYFDEKYLELLDFMLMIKLFGPATLTMKHLMEFTTLTQQTLKKMIKNINSKYEVIKINKQGKPYIYSLDLDVISQIEE